MVLLLFVNREIKSTQVATDRPVVAINGGYKEVMSCENQEWMTVDSPDVQWRTGTRSSRHVRVATSNTRMRMKLIDANTFFWLSPETWRCNYSNDTIAIVTDIRWLPLSTKCTPTEE